MNVASVALILVGAFYTFAGLVAARTGAISLVLDRAIAAIDLRPTPLAETAKAIWLIVNGLIVLVGGAALMLRLDIALWAFVTALASQGFFIIVLAPLWFDRREAVDADDRRSTINAAILYGAATAFVAWASAAGQLLAWRTQPTWLLAAGGGAVMCYTLHLTWLVRR